MLPALNLRNIDHVLCETGLDDQSRDPDKYCFPLSRHSSLVVVLTKTIAGEQSASYSAVCGPLQLIVLVRQLKQTRGRA